jgi:hypothetical protein
MTTTNPSAPPQTPNGTATREDTSAVGVSGSGAVLGPGSYRADADYKAARAAVEADRAIDKADKGHAFAAEVALRGEWGTDTENNLGLIARYIAGLPAAEREEIELGELENGTLALNDPAFLKELLEEARGQMPATPEGIAEEITKLEAQMRANRNKWMRDPTSQARYRELLRRRG